MTTLMCLLQCNIGIILLPCTEALRRFHALRGDACLHRNFSSPKRATIEDVFTTTSPKLTKKDYGCQKISATDVGNYTITV